MNARLATIAIALFSSPFAAAQGLTEVAKPDPVLDAIREFNHREEPKPAAPEEKTAIASPPPEEAPKTPEPGLVVRVEKLHTGQGAIDPAGVKLTAPFPAKPLAPAPPGWRFDVSDSAPPFTREVELAPGSKITLSIRPHLLVPDSDGTSVFAIAEPGYQNPLGYQQNSTVGAILSSSIRQLEEDSKNLGTAIDSLQQLLISLPKPEPAAAPAPTEISRPLPIRKR
ncbi:hypothetical protein HQ447_17355 [bacterium]|nr:hypothetical protein [bacterium]